MVLVTSVRGVRWVPETDTEEAEKEEEMEAQLDWEGWMSGRTSAGVVELGVHRSPMSNNSSGSVSGGSIIMQSGSSP